jgi:hypothetical protein
MSTILTNTFAELTADGQSASVELPAAVCDVELYLDDAETWGGGTLILESSHDGGTTWVAVTGASWTAGDGYIAKVRCYGQDLRLSLSGSTTPSLTATVKAVAVSEAHIHNVTLTANGTTDVVLPRGKAYAIRVTGTFDSGSLTVEESPDGTLYVNSIAAITAAGGGEYANAGANTLLHLVLASVVTAADLDVQILSA